MILLLSFSACDSGDSDIPDGDDEVAIDGDMDEDLADTNDSEPETNVCLDVDGDYETPELSDTENEVVCSYEGFKKIPIKGVYCQGVNICLLNYDDQWNVIYCSEFCGTLVIACESDKEYDMYEDKCVCSRHVKDDKFNGECNPESDGNICNGNHLCRCYPTGSQTYPGIWQAYDCKEYCDYLGKVTCGCIDGRATLQEACICR